MADVVVKMSILAKYCRDERWDIFHRFISILMKQYETKTGTPLNYRTFYLELEKAGIVPVVKSIAGKVGFRLRTIPQIDYPFVTFSVYDDGSIVITPSKEK